MYLKRLLAFLCCFTLVFCLFPSSAFATGGNGNIDGGGGSMGHGTSSNFWNSGNDGVRITVVDASSGTAVSSPLDFSNRTQKTSLLHFGKVNKLQYLGGAGLSLQSGVAYSCITICKMPCGRKHRRKLKKPRSRLLRKRRKEGCLW